jgi:hypothetical protein
MELLTFEYIEQLLLFSFEKKEKGIMRQRKILFSIIDVLMI